MQLLYYLYVSAAPILAALISAFNRLLSPPGVVVMCSSLAHPPSHFPRVAFTYIAGKKSGNEIA